MKALIFALLFASLPCPAHAAVDRVFHYDISQLLRDLDDAQAQNMEDALAALPEELRSSFTLQYEGGVANGHGLQGATPARPRVILFADDGAFALTFTGDDSMSMGNSWEMIQFVEPEGGHPAFELYSLEFPLLRDSFGTRVTQPVKNSSKCLACHTSDPKPIWGVYNNWPGIYDEVNTPQSAHHSDLVAFLANRSKLPRYSELLPLAGSDESPFTADQSKTASLYKFLPSTRLNHGLIRRNSIKMADRFAASPYYAKLLPLLVLTMSLDSPSQDGLPTDPNSVAFKLIHPSCGDPSTVSTDWGWSQADVDLTTGVVREIITAGGANPLPYPSDPVLGPRNILSAFGIRYGSLFPLWRAIDSEPDPSVYDDFLEEGDIHNSWIDSARMYQDLVTNFPALGDGYVMFEEHSMQDFFYDAGLSKLLTADYDVPRIQYWDSLGKPAHIDPASSCKALYNSLRTALSAIGS